jgi:2-polyprenyl-3-methyl-5-hydroxy-6-metoxy-1,4-benzoquinol methylase
MSENTLPEQYWIDRDGLAGVNDGPTPQARVYEEIAKRVVELGATKVLDLGCNIGALFFYLVKAGYTAKYEGIDSNPKAVEFAKSYHPANAGFNVGNLRDTKLRGKSQDVVVIKDVIEHLESAALLQDAFQIAKRYVIISTNIPFTNEVSDRIERTAAGYYLNAYTQGTVKAIALENEFWPKGMALISDDLNRENQVWVFERVAAK